MYKLTFAALFVYMALISCGSGEENPTVDLDDYIDKKDVLTSASKNKKTEELSTSETGYYGALPYHGHGHGHAGHGHGHGHHVVAHGLHPVAHVGHHHIGYAPYHYGHAQTYLTGIYGGYGHVGSAHVSYGTHINHGHAHGHHHHHGFYR